MHAITIAFLLLLQMTAFNVQGEEMVGTWVSTVAPGSREAPAVQPRFSVTKDGTEIVVHIDREPALNARVLFAAGGTSVLIVRLPPRRGGNRTVIIKPIREDEVAFELYVEYLERDPKRQRSDFFYSEVFKRVLP